MTSQIAMSNHRRFTMVSSYAKLQKSSLWIFSHSFCRVLPFFELDAMGLSLQKEKNHCGLADPRFFPHFFVDEGLRDSDRERIRTTFVGNQV